MCDERAIETHVVPRLTAAAEGVGRPVPRVADLAPGTSLVTRFADGTVTSSVTDV